MLRPPAEPLRLALRDTWPVSQPSSKPSARGTRTTNGLCCHIVRVGTAFSPLQHEIEQPRRLLLDQSPNVVRPTQTDERMTQNAERMTQTASGLAFCDMTETFWPQWHAAAHDAKGASGAESRAFPRRRARRRANATFRSCRRHGRPGFAVFQSREHVA
jgi:hypothetical protein